jgi:hypothetical protein
MPDQEPDKVLDILVGEYESCTKYIRELESQTQKISGLSFSIIGIAFGIGVKENIHAIFLLIPAALIAFIFYIINLAESITILGSYGADLEERINDRVGAIVLRWETKLSPKFRHGNLSRMLLTVISLIATLVMFIYALNQTFGYYSRTVFWLQVVFLGLSLIGAVGLIIQIPKLRPKVLKVCRQLDEKKDSTP